MNRDGQARQKSGSHAVLWSALAVVAAPVLYLLTIPVVARLAMPPPSAFGHSTAPVIPSWLTQYAKPAQWVAEESPMKKPYDAYLTWCFKKLEK